MNHATSLPDDLPRPEDDGACDHLPGMHLLDIALPSTQGDQVTLASLPGRTIVFCYPRTAGPGEAVSEDWTQIPGARGCTPESCAFRDLHRDFQEAGARVVGMSVQTTAAQQEASTRLHLPYPLLSDASLRFAHALRLPTLQWHDQDWIRRLTLIVNGGTIEHVFYPVFPPDTHPAEVLAWLRSGNAN